MGKPRNGPEHILVADDDVAEELLKLGLDVVLCFDFFSSSIDISGCCAFSAFWLGIPRFGVLSK